MGETLAVLPPLLPSAAVSLVVLPPRSASSQTREVLWELARRVKGPPVRCVSTLPTESGANLPANQTRGQHDGAHESADSSLSRRASREELPCGVNLMIEQGTAKIH